MSVHLTTVRCCTVKKNFFIWIQVFRSNLPPFFSYFPLSFSFCVYKRVKSATLSPAASRKRNVSVHLLLRPTLCSLEPAPFCPQAAEDVRVCMQLSANQEPTGWILKLHDVQANTDFPARVSQSALYIVRLHYHSNDGLSKSILASDWSEIYWTSTQMYRGPSSANNSFNFQCRVVFAKTCVKWWRLLWESSFRFGLF